MMLNPPKIDGETTEEQLRQVKRYLFQLVEELNWALEDIEKTAQKKEQ